MTFHKGFFPTRLEGKLSSVTEVKLKEGNLQEHQRTLTLDMSAASATLEGPIIRNKMSYVVSLRRSWLDFFDSLLSEEERLNHASYDYTAKVVYNTSESSSLQLLTYGSRDNYLWPDENGKEYTGLRWDNQIYQAAYHTRLGKVENRTAVYYTSHLNRADASLLGIAEEGYVHNNIRTFNASAEFGIRPDDQYQAHWGARYTHEAYEWTVPEDASRMRREPVHQFSLFYDNDLRVAATYMHRWVCTLWGICRRSMSIITASSRASHCVIRLPSGICSTSTSRRWSNSIITCAWTTSLFPPTSACPASKATSRARPNITRRDGSISLATVAWSCRLTTRRDGTCWLSDRSSSWRITTGTTISWRATATAMG